MKKRIVSILVEDFIEDESRVNAFRSATSQMRNIGAEAMLLDLASERSKPLPGDKPMEQAALRAAWHDGYVECLRDIFRFAERYIFTKEEQEAGQMNFGAPDELLKSGDINEEEYEQLTGHRPITN